MSATNFGSGKRGLARRLALSVFLAVGLANALLAGAAGYQAVPKFLKVPEAWRLEQVSAVAVGTAGEIYAFNRGPHSVAVFDKQGNFLRSFGEGIGKSSHGLRLDAAGNIWTTDWKDHAVRKFTADGKLVLTMGEPGKPGNDPAHFNQPTDIAFASDGGFYISDGYGNSRVLKFDREAKFLFAWGKKGKGPGEFNLPHAVRLDSKGLVYVGDRENNRIQVFEAEGKFVRQFAGMAPYGLFITPEDKIFVADGRGNKVLVLDTAGTKLNEWGAMGSEPGNFIMPHGIAVGGDGAVYVAEINGKRLQKFVREGF